MLKTSNLLLYFTLYLAILAFPSHANALTFSFIEGANLTTLKTTNPTQYAGFMQGIHAGASLWTDTLSTDVHLTVAVDTYYSESGIVAGCSPTFTRVPYSAVQSALYGLPIAPPPFDTSGTSMTVDSSVVWATTANLKALGLLPADAVGIDMDIVINTLYSWDFDSSDGVSPGAIDLQTVMGHEVGHGLGALSSADAARPGATWHLNPHIMDLRRFSGPGVRDMSARQVDRYLSVNEGATDLDGGAVDQVLSWGTGNGDEQAHHWRSGHGLGIMDPLISAGVSRPVSSNDLDFMESLGWTVKAQGTPAASEPPVIWFVVMALLFVLRLRTS